MVMWPVGWKRCYFHLLWVKKDKRNRVYKSWCDVDVTVSWVGWGVLLLLPLTFDWCDRENAPFLGGIIWRNDDKSWMHWIIESVTRNQKLMSEIIKKHWRDSTSVGRNQKALSCIRKCCQVSKSVFMYQKSLSALRKHSQALGECDEHLVKA